MVDGVYQWIIPQEWELNLLIATIQENSYSRRHYESEFIRGMEKDGLTRMLSPGPEVEDYYETYFRDFMIKMKAADRENRLRTAQAPSINIKLLHCYELKVQIDITSQESPFIECIRIKYKETLTPELISSIELNRAKLRNVKSEIEIIRRQEDILTSEKDSKNIFNKADGELGLILHIYSLLGMKGSLDRKVITDRDILLCHPYITKYFSQIKRIFNLRCEKPPKTFGTLKRFIDSIFFRWSGCKLHCIKEGRGDNLSLYKMVAPFPEYDIIIEMLE